jgi:TolB-like protein/tetratricopeptide (TPR) repeat protein
MRSGGSIYEFGRFRLDAHARLLLLEGRPVALPTKVFDLLLLLVQNSGQVVTKEELMRQVWPDQFVEENNLTVRMSALRRALGEKRGGQRYIETVPRLGYRFVARVREVEDQVVAFTEEAKPAEEGKISIAVLPLLNIGKDGDMEYLSDGITESIINDLSQLPQLKVIAQTSTFKYKGKEIDPHEVANALGVQAIVTGRIVRLGDTLQISVELVNARNNTQMWGEQYSRKAVDLQTVQGEIARTISEKLRIRLTGTQEQQVTKRATENPEAYQLYLTGEFYGRRGRIEDKRQALDYYNRAVGLDPNFALAYVGVAGEYENLAAGSLSDSKDALAKAKAAVNKALELDEMLAQAHTILGLIKFDEWDWTGAEIEFKRALELNPNLARAHSSYGLYLTVMGRPTEALAENKRAQELDPLNIYVKLGEGLALLNAGRFDEAIRQLQHVIELQPDFSLAHYVLGASYALKGMYSEAIAEYQKFSSIEGEKTENEIYLGYAYAMSGQRENALAILNRLKTTKEYVSPAELAILYVGLGDKEGAFQELERAYAAHDLQMQYLKVEHHYDALRSDPRFTDLIRRVGLPL